jgi:hypothetical protein
MRIGVLLLAVGFLGIAIAAVPYTREFLAVDSCLDGGGSFDYAVAVCDHAANHPHVLFATRHPSAIPVALAGTVSAAVGLLLWRHSS